MALSEFIHNSNITLKRFRLKELREEFLEFLSFLFGVSLSGRGKDLVNGIRPPRSNEFILVREEELVAGRAAENGGRNADDGGFEDIRLVLIQTVEDELLRVAFPASGQELEALTKNGKAYGAGRNVGIGEQGFVLVEEDEESEREEKEEED